MSTMNESTFSYIERCRAGYPGWEPRGGKKKSAELQALKDAAYKWSKRVEALKSGGMTPDLREALDNFEKYKTQYEELDKAITSGTAFVDQSVENLEYIPSDYGFSLGDYSGRRSIGANRAREPMDLYNDTTTAEEVVEGTESTPKDLTDSLALILTESAERIHFNDTLLVSTGAYNDDSEVMDEAFRSAHIRHFANAENAKAVKILTGCKAAVALDADNLQTAINGNLCGKAKRNAVILTNKAGFAKLDIDDSYGRPLITKDQNGNFIYKGKYQVVELPDEIIPNTENGSPCIIGDIKGVLRFYVVRNTALFKDDIFPYLTGDREIREEIITLTTESNEAFIWGNLV